METGSARPLLHVTKGHADPDELAAVTAVLMARAGARAADTAAGRPADRPAERPGGGRPATRPAFLTAHSWQGGS
ncbi:acyl-CoA carboxylase subunit epsilon [Streptomyces genisteinicus]|uniref:Acyl-CoA carboxylase subunit epsilon n=1 Tax=Streptomyces genisteinicus TaxID=2768068 RepID=A0A7H0HXM6_9ACTN|nr:acyl-CoA carboxylase subunit epsilon [Streptomyces genisteinicus]QNP65292.1 acyl-CoA carboxylase subunit epsilon [Streptomyces genisteinicus]